MGAVTQKGSRNDLVGSERQGSSAQGSSTLSTTSATTTNIGKGASTNNRGVHYLSHAEFTRRKEAKLCFTCGKAWELGNHCSERGLRVTILAEEEELTEEGRLERSKW